MTLTEIIELGVGTVTIAIVLYKMNVSLNVKINENALKIIQLDKDLMELKKKHNEDVTTLKADHESILERIRKENREDHGKLFNTLTEVQKQIVEVGTSVRMHISAENEKH